MQASQHVVMGQSSPRFVTQFKHGQYTVWTHSQGVFPLRKALAEMVALPACASAGAAAASTGRSSNASASLSMLPAAAEPSGHQLIDRTMPPSTRNAAPVVAEACIEQM